MSFRPTPRNAPGAMRRAFTPAAFAASLLLAAPGAHAQGAPAASAVPTDRIVILSTSDVKAKTMPCGCSIPKGGLSRRAGFTDSLRRVHPDLLVVDSGGFFPDSDAERDDAPFLAEAMHDLGLAAAGLSGRELRFGRAFLLATLERAAVPAVCANLLDKSGQPPRPLVRPWLVQKVGKHKVGVFGLIHREAPLGPSADSLETTDPAEAARRAVAELRKQGATIIVLLSSLGRVETEDLVLVAPGIDVAIAGRNVPLLQRSREIESTTVVYGGEQGQYAGVTELGLDAKGRIVSRESGTWMLGPDVVDQPAMLAKVTAFEARPEVKARRAPARPAAGEAAGHDDHAGHSH